MDNFKKYFYANSSGAQAARMFGANSSLQQPSTVGHLENQMASALVLKSSSEYHFWFTTYVRYIVQEGEFVRPVYTEHLQDDASDIALIENNGELQPATKLRQGYVFTSVCQEFCPVGGGGLCPSMHHRSHDWEGLCPRGVSVQGGSLLGRPPGQRPSPPGGTHPTGMHSCFQ